MGRTIGSIAGIAGVVIMAVAAWQLLDRRGPPGLYERAPGTRSMKIRVGPNAFRLASMSRSDRRGQVRAENGMGRSVLQAPDHPVDPRTCSWLDEVRATISSEEPFDIVEARIFDASTRSILSDGSGWTVAGGGIDLRRPGGLLPPCIDIWLRVVHAPRRDPAARLGTEPGVRAPIGSGAVVLRELRRGSWGWSQKRAPDGSVSVDWTGPATDLDGAITVALDWTPGPGGASAEDLAVVAILKDGRRVAPDFPHFLRLGPGERLGMLAIDAPLEELGGLELRPFRGRDVFYFQDVLLPAVGPISGRPPAAEVRVDGKETDARARGLEPIPIRVRVLAGVRGRGIVGKSGRAVIDLAPADPGDAGKTTIVYEVRGVAPPSVDISVLNRLGSLMAVTGGSSSSASSPGRYAAGYRVLDVPLDRIGTVRIELPAGGERSGGGTRP